MLGKEFVIEVENSRVVFFPRLLKALSTNVKAVNVEMGH